MPVAYINTYVYVRSDTHFMPVCVCVYVRNYYYYCYGRIVCLCDRRCFAWKSTPYRVYRALTKRYTGRLLYPMDAVIATTVTASSSDSRCVYVHAVLEEKNHCFGSSNTIRQAYVCHKAKKKKIINKTVRISKTRGIITWRAKNLMIRTKNDFESFD